MLAPDILLDPASIPADLREFFEPPALCGQCFVCHLVECFRAVRRVLRDDGCLFVNMGDSYAGGGQRPTGYNGITDQARRQGFINDKQSTSLGSNKNNAATGGIPPTGYKAKDLMEIPSMVAQALRADGWYLRSRIPWLKRNAMPESVTDRPASSVEYVFLLSKSARYYWDADAVRRDSQPWATKKPDYWDTGAGGHGTIHRNGREKGVNTGDERTGRNFRNGDLFFESWQGLLLDEDDAPLALVVNPAPLKIAHYASFPPKLVEPMVKASTSEKGCCPECGAPWVRQSTAEYLPTDRKPPPNKGHNNGAMGERAANMTRDGWIPNRDPVRATVGWRPSCAHAEATPVPCTVLDPFAGAGTTLMVADRLGRNAIGCELSEDYADMGTARVVGDAPMFVQMESGSPEREREREIEMSR